MATFEEAEAQGQIWSRAPVVKDYGLDLLMHCLPDDHRAKIQYNEMKTKIALLEQKRKGIFSIRV